MMGNGALAGTVLSRPSRGNRLQPLCTVSGFEVCVLTSRHHDGLADPLVQEALALERSTMRRLGDQEDVIDFDIAETIGCSTFVLVVGSVPTRPHAHELIGAVRFMVGGRDGVKTLWDVDRLSPRLRGPRHPWMGDPTQLIDAMALSPAPDTGLSVAAVSDVLMAACTIVGGALVHSGRARYLTAYIHQRFHRHIARLGYPFHRFVPDDHAANYDEFLPVIASLEAIDALVRAAPSGSHFGDLRHEYRRVVDGAAELGTVDW